MKRIRPARLVPAGVAAGLALLAAQGAGAAPRVVVTLAPVHSLVAGVTRGVVEPDLVVRGSGSPHAYALRPSDAARLSTADLVVWVGEPLEIFLVRPLATLSERTERMRLLDLPGLIVHSTRSGGGFEADPAHEAEAGHAPGPVVERDPHLWLDPRNALVAVRAVAERLERIDPGNAAVYARNARSLAARIESLDAALARRIAPVRGVPFVVFHDAFQYFERRYGLTAAGSVTLGPERLPGARRLVELRARIAAVGARCLFREPQFSSPLLETVLDSSGARAGVLDPLGSDVEPGPELWFVLMERLAEGFRACLSP